MTIPPTSYRFYGELARWWPLISPPEDYTEEAAFAASLLHRAAHPVREVLELGSGGGHNAVHLKEHFAMTLVDLSEAMLDVSRRLNPESLHRQGDMRTIRLGREFDAVFIHDAIDYMTDEADLRRAMETAFVHCRPGGLALLMPDDIRETFKEGTDHGGDDAAAPAGDHLQEVAVGIPLQIDAMGGKAGLEARRQAGGQFHPHAGSSEQQDGRAVFPAGPGQDIGIRQ